MSKGKVVHNAALMIYPTSLCYKETSFSGPSSLLIFLPPEPIHFRFFPSSSSSSIPVCLVLDFPLPSSFSSIDPALIGDKKCNVPPSLSLIYLCIYPAFFSSSPGICERRRNGLVRSLPSSDVGWKEGGRSKNCSFPISISIFVFSFFLPRPKVESKNGRGVVR